jgi:hypothetical protein
MEKINPKNVFEATNSDLSPEELENKIRLLEVKLEKLREEESILDLAANDEQFEAQVSGYDVAAELLVQINDLKRILASKEEFKKAA